MVHDASRSPRAIALLTLTCALAAGIGVVQLYARDPLGILENARHAIGYVALIAAVVSAIVVALAARKSVAHVFVFGGLAGAIAGGGYMLVMSSGALAEGLHLPRTLGELLELALVGLFVSLATLFVSVVGATMGVVCSAFHVVPVALVAREHALQRPDMLSRVALACAGWLALVSGASIRLAMHAGRAWGLGVASSAFGLALALVFGVVGLCGVFSTFAPGAPSRS
jgi:hypothetical protein